MAATTVVAAGKEMTQVYFPNCVKCFSNCRLCFQLQSSSPTVLLSTAARDAPTALTWPWSEFSMEIMESTLVSGIQLGSVV